MLVFVLLGQYHMCCPLPETASPHPHSHGPAYCDSLSLSLDVAFFRASSLNYSTGVGSSSCGLPYPTNFWYHRTPLHLTLYLSKFPNYLYYVRAMRKSAFSPLNSCNIVWNYGGRPNDIHRIFKQ